MDATPAPLTVEVRLLPWDSEWTAYDSAEEAYRAGRRRLTRLTADRP